MPQTGPITPEGREISSRNATKHALSSKKMFVLQNETSERWESALQVWIDQLQPQTEAEYIIVVNIARAEWTLRRCYTVEVGLYDLEMDLQAPDLQKRCKRMDEGLRQTLAFKGLSDQSNSLALLQRYVTSSSRAIDRGLATLRTLRAMAAQRPPKSAPTDSAPSPQSDSGDGLAASSQPKQQPDSARDQFLQNEIAPAAETRKAPRKRRSSAHTGRPLKAFANRRRVRRPSLIRAVDQLSTSRTTFPWTSVRRKRRP